MEAIVSLCKRRGFVFPSSEIYGGLNGFFDYGPLGAELKKNIRDCWWNDMVRRRDDIVGIESSIIMHPKVWQASGHVAGFTDPMVDCKVSKQRYRADQLFWACVSVEVDQPTPIAELPLPDFPTVSLGGDPEKFSTIIGYVSAIESERTNEELLEKAESLKRKRSFRGKLRPLTINDFTVASEQDIPHIPSPATGEPGALRSPTPGIRAASA